MLSASPGAGHSRRLWEGDSAHAIGDFAEEVVGDANRTEFYEVDRRSAFGLPEARSGDRDAPAQALELEGEEQLGDPRESAMIPT